LIRTENRTHSVVLKSSEESEPISEGVLSNRLRNHIEHINKNLPRSNAGGNSELHLEGDRLKMTGQLGGWLSIGIDAITTIDIQVIPDYMLTIKPDNPEYPKLLIKSVIKAYERIKQGNKVVLTDFLSYGDTSAFNLSDLLIGSFATLCEKVLSEGLPRDYVTVTQRSSRFVGQLVPSKLIPDMWTSPHKLVQRINEFTSNVPKNQLIRVGYNTILTEKNNSGIDLEQFSPFFDNIDAIVPEYTFVDELAFDHDGTEYHALLQLCDLILNLRGIRTQNTTESSIQNTELLPGFIFKAWDVYEALCVVVMREVGEKMGWEIKDWAGKPNILADSRGRKEDLTYKPDIVVYRNGSPLCSMDAKCTSNDSVKREYRNQVLVAANDLGAKDAILLLPKTPKNQKIRTWDMKSSENWKTERFSIMYFDVPAYLDEKTRADVVDGLVKEFQSLLKR